MTLFPYRSLPYCSLWTDIILAKPRGAHLAVLPSYRSRGIPTCYLSWMKRWPSQSRGIQHTVIKSLDSMPSVEQALTPACG